MRNLVLQISAFDRSIGTSIVAVAWPLKPAYTSVEGWPSIAMAYFGRDVHLPLIALDLGSQLSSTISLTHIQSGRPGSENPDA